MLSRQFIQHLDTSRSFFERSSSVLAEEDSAFRPEDDMFTVAQHVASVALTIDWFIDGAFGDGFDLDFDTHLRRVREVTSLSQARRMLDASFARAEEVVADKSDEELTEPLPDGPIMGGLPRSAIFPAITDHNAHHRGALTVYARLLGKKPKMPYGDI